jgi:hypothetical protein
MMHNPDSRADRLQVRQSLRLAEKIGVRFMPVGVRRSDDLESAFGTLSAEGADALIVRHRDAGRSRGLGVDDQFEVDQRRQAAPRRLLRDPPTQAGERRARQQSVLLRADRAIE